jgi:hypothetical protein
VIVEMFLFLFFSDAKQKIAGEIHRAAEPEPSAVSVAALCEIMDIRAARLESAADRIEAAAACMVALAAARFAP